ncbi:MAG: HAMP domain-containing protein, partial [Planctomycetes bacterium]|nr:HAMP domain-containing protein [Planctomycetota bacterium]
MRLRTRFLLLFLASGLFLLVQGLAAAWSLRVVGRDVDRLQIYAQTDDLCGQIQAELAQLPSLDELSRPPTGRARRELRRHADRVLIHCVSLGKLTSSPSSRAAIAEIRSAVVVYRRSGVAYAEAQNAGRSGFRELDVAEPASREVVRVREEGVIEPVGHEARLATKAVVDRADSLNTWVTVGGLSLSLVFTVIGAAVLARATAHPIVRLLRAAREVQRGNLEVAVPIVTNDELGQLGQAFNDMTQSLRESRQGLEDKVRRRTEALRAREKDLERERKLAAVGRLAAGVAHEVSNPLTVIAGAAEGLRDRAKDPVFKDLPEFEDFPDYLEMIESEAYRLKKVVRRLLDFARVRPRVTQPCDLGEVVGDAVLLARLDPRAKEHPIHFVAPKSELELLGDPDALKEAVLNLLFNALDAVSDGGEVAARVGREDDDLFVEIADTGAGIEPQDLDRLFEPFFTTKDAGEGTGLGLALVYGTVER